MQFFLNGFVAGDPTRAPAAGASPRPLEQVDELDVLIVGSGPAGLVLAAQLASFPALRTRIVERRDGPLELGQADGVACRTVEMFEALGIREAVLREAYQVNETSFWGPDPTDGSRIVRTGRVPDVEDDLSECPHVILNQARVHDHLLAAMRRAPTRSQPDYGVAFEGLEIPDDPGEAVRVELRRGDVPLTITARAVVGCDGARSAVRRALGLELRGDPANHAWGVIDALVDTDFPDIRLKSAIRSPAGSILLIPREGGYLVRLYVDLGEVTADNRERVRATTAAEVAEAAARVLSPYRLGIEQVAWFSVYEVAQRLTDAFDDSPHADGPPRVFIAGDACHTHSAKAGLGMNVAMQDAFNLGWKLGAVLQGHARPELLSTYSAERHPIARELIDFDREWSALLAAAPGSALDDGAVQDSYVRQGRYTAGVATCYPASMITGPPSHQDLAAGLPVGMRLHSARVIRVADAQTMQLGHLARADGRWRLYAFADADERQLAELCDWLADDPASPIARFGVPGDDVDAVLDVRAILQRDHRTIDVNRLPALLRPRKGRFGLVDREKAFTAPPGLPGNVFDLRAIDRDAGCAVIVRPDQYVSQVLPLSATAEITAFFDGVLRAVEPVRA